MQREKAKEVAQDILEDRRGADYYQEIEILSSYLESQLGISKEKAEQTAKAIQEDRIGASFYENVDILADFLEK